MFVTVSVVHNSWQLEKKSPFVTAFFQPFSYWFSILFYGCEAWLLTQVLTLKLDKFARKCYWIMLGICQAEIDMTNTDLYCMAGEYPISETIRECQSQFNGHCFRMPKDEPAKIYVVYQSKIRQSSHCGNPGLTYLDQISKYLSTYRTVRF